MVTLSLESIYFLLQFLDVLHQNVDMLQQFSVVHNQLLILRLCKKGGIVTVMLKSIMHAETLAARGLNTAKATPSN